jgi:hypothetical protein
MPWNPAPSLIVSAPAAVLPGQRRCASSFQWEQNLHHLPIISIKGPATIMPPTNKTAMTKTATHQITTFVTHRIFLQQQR